jgi:hypothetical protein
VPKRRSSAQRLRASVEAMPPATRAAMLRGIDENEIIVGAYVDNHSGGICPMLAAHRHGERTAFGTFARAWDQFTRADPKKPRRATRREIRALRSYLERGMIGGEISGTPLGNEVRDVQASRRRLAEAEAREGADRSVEQMLSEAQAEAEQERSEQLAREHDATEPALVRDEQRR